MSTEEALGDSSALGASVASVDDDAFINQVSSDDGHRSVAYFGFTDDSCVSPSYSQHSANPTSAAGMYVLLIVGCICYCSSYFHVYEV